MRFMFKFRERQCTKLKERYKERKKKEEKRKEERKVCLASQLCVSVIISFLLSERDQWSQLSSKEYSDIISGLYTTRTPS